MLFGLMGRLPACLVLFVNGAHKNNNKKVIKQAKILSKHLSCVYYTHYIIYYYNLPTKLKITSIHPTSSKYIIINSFPLPHTHTHLFLAFFFCYCFVIIIFYIHIFNTLINNFINKFFSCFFLIKPLKKNQNLYKTLQLSLCCCLGLPFLHKFFPFSWCTFLIIYIRQYTILFLLVFIIFFFCIFIYLPFCWFIYLSDTCLICLYVVILSLIIIKWWNLLDFLVKFTKRKIFYTEYFFF